MNTFRSKLIALFGIMILGATFYAGAKVLGNKDIFPKKNDASGKTLSSTIGDNAKARAQLEAGAKPIFRSGSNGTIDSNVGVLIQAKFSLVISKTTFPGKILYIKNKEELSFKSLKVENVNTPYLLPYTLDKNVSLTSGSYDKNGWCLVLRRGGAYEKITNLDTAGYISFGAVSCRNGR